MSFTVVHRKDGKDIPIKMSIWDAFSGVPNPRPKKAQTCACCGKLHGQTSEVRQDNTKKDAKPSHSTSEKEIYTDADNTVITEMKNANATWKEILKAIGKSSESQLKDHYKDNLKDKSSDASQQVVEKKIDDNIATSNKNQGKAGKKVESDNQKKSKDGEQKNNKEHDGNLKSWAANYDQKKWLTMASKHFDKTGQRITAEMARKLAENK